MTASTERTPREMLPAVVVFDVPGHDGTAATRLKRFLKAALRVYGLRCVECRYPTPAELEASGEVTQDRTT